jgi:acetyltransferase-like isoleucine patch superfamily enzyme
MAFEREISSIKEISGAEQVNFFVYLFRYLKNWFLGRLASNFPIPSVRVKLYRMQGIKIGKNVYIGCDVLFDRINPEYITIDDYAGIGDRCIITAHQHVPELLHDEYPRIVKPVHIGRGANIFPGSIINNGVSIGERSVIGTGSVVLWDIPPNSVAQGNPAKIIRKLEFSESLTSNQDQHTR